ncbi:uncharacterized protein LOC114008261 [Tupaia chinensis]|uniref:uncharacterized protein LOC114008261 n=1 Tax=Tupaia chinensis TaxID=246437 RepID=UPI000FFCBD86|nr:uncharacterized protein LOC114008261 [Tupaia chinensis]
MTSEKFGHYTSSVYLHNYINYEMSLSQKSIRNSESTSSTQEAVCMLGFARPAGDRTGQQVQAAGAGHENHSAWGRPGAKQALNPGGSLGQVQVLLQTGRVYRTSRASRRGRELEGGRAGTDADGRRSCHFNGSSCYRDWDSEVEKRLGIPYQMYFLPLLQLGPVKNESMNLNSLSRQALCVLVLKTEKCQRRCPRAQPSSKSAKVTPLYLFLESMWTDETLEDLP